MSRHGRNSAFDLAALRENVELSGGGPAAAPSQARSELSWIDLTIPYYAATSANCGSR